MATKAPGYQAMRKEIAMIAETIADHFAPEKIILFGSYAYGTPGEDSDLDLLVVLPFRGKSVYKAIDIMDAVKPTIPIDFIVRTPEQMQLRLKQKDFFLSRILKQGKVLCEAAHP
jgi:predicted nucleotidyltransferase